MIGYERSPLHKRPVHPANTLTAVFGEVDVGVVAFT